MGSPFPSAIRSKEWVDASGARWQMRGTPATLTVKRAERLIRSSEVKVLHFFGPDGPPVEVPLADRAALWARIHPYLRTAVRAPGDYTDFAVAEFRDDRRRVLVAVEQAC